MHKIFISQENISNDLIILSDKEKVHHLKDVLRLQVNEKIKASDSNGNLYNCVVSKVSGGQVILQIKERLFVAEQAVSITIACAIPKNSRFEDIIDKLTQLGVERIIPLITTRTIVKLDKKKATLRKARWEKIALSSSQQSLRNGLPKIDPVSSVKEVLKNSGEFDFKLIPSLVGNRIPLSKVLMAPGPKRIIVLIGPEGDFTEEEVNLALDAGFIPVTLGELVLRVETAAIAVASYIRLC